MAGESEFLEWIASQQKSAGSASSQIVKIGVGDDLAALKWPTNELLLVGVDQALDGVHFDSSVHSPRQIGRKVVNRNFSDCAAMACIPAAIVAAVALPKTWSIEQAKEIYAGLRDAADKFDCPLIGGDTATWSGKLAATVTVLGRSGGGTPVTRGAAKIGDYIFVTGALGGSILGRHMDFEPRVALGLQIGAFATAMIDVSDGLSRDLGNICRAGGVGATIDADRVPIHADAIELARRDGTAALSHALNDGEDYELLYTTSRAEGPGVCIGRITAGEGIWIEDQRHGRRPLIEMGFVHQLGDR